jgi:dihydrofolate reductase
MISIICCMDIERNIGYENKIPWSLPNDLQYFKRKTTGHKVIMGRKTYESIGKPLPNRENIILTNNTEYVSPGCKLIHSIEEVLHDEKNDEVFIIGGENVYKHFLPYADKMYLTIIDHVFKGDSKFPNFDEEKWTLVNEVVGVVDERNKYDHRFLTYEKKR